jgi:type I restriction enzyme S subunit
VGMMSKKSPQLRFEGFTDDWEERKLSEIGKIVTGNTPSTSNKGYYNGDFLFVSPADIQENRYVNKTTTTLTELGFKTGRLVPKGATLFVSIGSTIGKIGQSICDVITNQQINSVISFSDYDDDFIYTSILNSSTKIKQLAATQAVPIINKNEFGKSIIKIPSLEEQQKIGAFFKQLDDTIALHQRKLDLLKEQKKGYLQKMFPKNGAKVPELRFAGFADDWEERKLSSGLREYTDRVIVEDDKEYYQISVRNNFGGITLRGSKMGNKIGRKRQAKINLTKYPQTLIFTRQTVEQGGIGWVDKYCDGAIVTENMPTISLDTSVFSKYFLTNLFQTRIFYKNAILDNIEGGSAQIAIHESKFLSSTLLFPNLDEQEKIGQFFKQLDDTIDLHQRKLDLLKEQKKGFLQKMFV